jgi:hypothetical protein
MSVTQAVTKESVVREYRRKNPTMPTKTLARLIYNIGSNNLMFTNIEDVRSNLRRIEGKTGEKQKKGVKDKSLFLDEPRPYNPFNLPDSDEVKKVPVDLSEYNKIGLISDLHVPYHSIEALTITIAYLKTQNIDCLLILGDLVDFYQLSRFMKDPRKRSPYGEVKTMIEVLEVLHRELNCKIIYKYGNHCIRFAHYLWQKSGEIFHLTEFEEIKEFTLENVLNRRLSFKLDVIHNEKMINYRGLTLVHGNEIGGGIFSPVSAARGLFTRTKASAICGHHHRSSKHTEKTINDDIISNWSIGCLCELSPDYLPVNNWNHGFAVIEGNENNYYVSNKEIINGKVF